MSWGSAGSISTAETTGGPLRDRPGFLPAGNRSVPSGDGRPRMRTRGTKEWGTDHDRPAGYGIGRSGFLAPGTWLPVAGRLSLPLRACVARPRSRRSRARAGMPPWMGRVPRPLRESGPSSQAGVAHPSGGRMRRELVLDMDAPQSFPHPPWGREGTVEESLRIFDFRSRRARFPHRRRGCYTCPSSDRTAESPHLCRPLLRRRSGGGFQFLHGDPISETLSNSIFSRFCEAGPVVNPAKGPAAMRSSIVAPHLAGGSVQEGVSQGDKGEGSGDHRLLFEREFRSLGILPGTVRPLEGDQLADDGLPPGKRRAHRPQ